MSGRIPDVERRRAIRRRKSRRKHLLVAFAVLLVIAFLAFLILSVTVLFPIKTVYAGGSAIYTQREIADACKLKNKNIILASEKSTEEIIRKELPYTDSVKIEKKFPDTVKITVKDAREYACYKIDLSYYIVSEKGYVLKKVISPRNELIVIEASGVTCKVSEQVKFSDEKIKENTEKILSVFESKKIKINKIDTTSAYSIKATVEDKYDVNFGFSSDLESKCNHLVSMLDEINESGGGSIDLSGWTQTNRQGTFKKKSLH